MYLPKSKYKSNLYAEPGVFVYASNKAPYTGPYFENYTGKYFTGTEPSRNSKEIIFEPEEASPDFRTSIQGLPITEYDAIRNNQEEFQLKLTEPIPVHYPNPTPQDYQRGTFIRYFLRNRSTGTILEVSKEVYKAIIDKTPKYYYPGYTAGGLIWRIRGPLNTVTRQGYPQAGARSINKAAVEKLEPTLPGISLYLFNLGQFVR